MQLGGFTGLDLDRLEDALHSLKNGDIIKDFRLPKDLNPTNVEIAYLNKILQLCNEKQVKLMLINLPKREELLKDKRYGMKEFQNLYNIEFSQLDYFDFSSFPMEDEMLADL